MTTQQNACGRCPFLGFAAEQLRLPPKPQARLATIQREIEQLDPPPPTTDLAAWTGVGHSSERRYRSRAELHEEATPLPRLIGTHQPSGSHR